MPTLTAQELAGRKAGETAETNGFGQQERPLRKAGVYQLKNEAGEVVDTLICKVHPKFGDSQAAAAERVGYRWQRDVKPGEVKEIEVDAKFLATEGNHAEDSKGVQARITLLEQSNKKKDEQIDALLAQLNKGASDNEVAATSKEETKVEAEARTEARLDESVGSSAEETQRTEELKSEKTEDTPPSDAELKADKEETPAPSGNASKGGGSNTNTNKKEGK